MIESECNTFPHFANCSTGSYQGLISYKTTKSVARKGNRFFVLRYKSRWNLRYFPLESDMCFTRNMFGFANEDFLS